MVAYSHVSRVVSQSASDSRRPRIAVLWTALSGYRHASLLSLADENVDLLVYRREVVAGKAPFDDDAITSGIYTRIWSDRPDVSRITNELDNFEPDAILVCSWNIGGYRKIARHFRGRTLRVLCLPNQWFATPKQRAGTFVSPLLIRPTYDAAFVCGERQALFASKLGFSEDRLIWGLNTCDQPLYATVAQERGGLLPPKSFLFVGRLVPDKAIDVIAAGYEQYRQGVKDPWPLHVAGVGPQEDLLQGRDGIELEGFVQPVDLPDLFRRTGCLVLPSRFEPWGVVIHEATSAGLPVICSHVCGASTRLVLDGYNGVVVPHDDTEAFASALTRIHNATDDERIEMGRASSLLSLQFTPQRWAKTLLGRLPELRSLAGLDPAPWTHRHRKVETESI